MKYKEALERAEKLSKELTVGNIFEHVFPELKEIKDKTISRAIKYGMKYLEREIGWDFANDVDFIDIYAWLEKQGGKPADKIEHKFKVGDWITTGLNIKKIIAVETGLYVMEMEDGTEVSLSVDYVERNYHLWTIQDAKPGDVVTTESDLFGNLFIAMCKEVGADSFNTYCFFASGIFFTEDDESFSIDDVHPATKEQRDLLFKCMKNCGYEWDSDRLELKSNQEEKQKWGQNNENTVSVVNQIITDKQNKNNWNCVYSYVRKWLKSINENLSANI